MYPHILTLRSDSQSKIAAKCHNFNIFHLFWYHFHYTLLELEMTYAFMALKIAGVLASNGESTPMNSYFGKAELTLVPAQSQRFSVQTALSLSYFFRFLTTSQIFSKLNWAGPLIKSNTDNLKIKLSKNLNTSFWKVLEKVK